MRSQIYTTISVIRNQAKKMGFGDTLDMAATGTAYITFYHDSLENEFLMRVGDHEPNEARYKFKINNIPDSFVDVGFQVAAVKELASLVGIDHNEIAYLRSAKKREEKKINEKNERIAKREDEKADWKRRNDIAMNRITEESKSVLSVYATLHGKQRKSYRKTTKYRKATSEVARLMEEVK